MRGRARLSHTGPAAEAERGSKAHYVTPWLVAGDQKWADTSSRPAAVNPAAAGGGRLVRHYVLLYYFLAVRRSFRRRQRVVVKNNMTQTSPTRPTDPPAPRW